MPTGVITTVKIPLFILNIVDSLVGKTYYSRADLIRAAVKDGLLDELKTTELFFKKDPINLKQLPTFSESVFGDFKIELIDEKNEEQIF